MMYHLVNVRVVLKDVRNSVGLTEVSGAYDYYAGGMLMPGRSFSSGSYEYGFAGKRMDNEIYGTGNAYDFGARIYDPRLIRWSAVDPLAVKYPQLSPYNYAGNMLINAVDPDGRDIIVLNDVDGANGAGHQAVLIGNEKDGWTYISKDGFKDGAFGSEPLYTVKTFKSIKEFANSSHNRVVDPNSPYFQPTKEHPNLTNSYDADGNLDANGKEGTKGGGIMDWNFYDTEEGSYDRKQRYDNAFYIETDSKTDALAVKAAVGSASEEYCLANGDCSDVVTSALEQAKTRTGEKVHTGENTIPLLQGISIWDYFIKSEYPNQKQKVIEEKNKTQGYDVDNLIVPANK